jgi:sugar (pentulose or hexulose) kinase
MSMGLGIFEREGVQIDGVLGHGGFFETPGVGQRIMAAAMNVPVSVMETAGEGGAVCGLSCILCMSVRLL